MRLWFDRIRRWWRPSPLPPKVRERQLHDWYRTDLGRSLQAAERRLVSDVLNSGYHPFVVQLDVGLHQPLFDAQQLKCKSSLLIARTEATAHCPSACADLDYLPLQAESVDSVVVHHALEFSNHPHRVLREAVQALRPGGHLIVIGFNPYGFWGLSRLWRWRRAQKPWEGNFLSMSRVMDWCELLDCGEVRHTYFYHWPPLSSSKWKHKGVRLNRFIRTFLPILGGNYLLVVRKNQLELLSDQRWQPAFFLKGKVMSKQREQVANRWKS